MFSRGSNKGYTKGGLDVVTAVNLFFKGILLFPIFLLAGYIGVIMMKHMIFQGIPSMSVPTQQQQELIQNRNHQIGIQPSSTQEPSVKSEYKEVQREVETPQYYSTEIHSGYYESYEGVSGRRTLDEALDDYTQEYYYD